MKSENKIAELAKNNKKKIIVYIIAIIVLLSILTFSFFKIFDASLLTNSLTGQIIREDYSNIPFASPVDVFENEQVFSITPENFDLVANPGSLVESYVNITHPGAYIYKKGYYLGYNLATHDNTWVEFDFPGPTIGNSNWIADYAEKMLSITPAGTLRNGRYNFVLAYSCKKYLNDGGVWTRDFDCDTRIDPNCEWKCGCHDDKTTCNNWMLHYFIVNAGGADGSVISCENCLQTFCDSDNDCDVNEVCMDDLCVNRLVGEGTPDNPFRIYNITDLQNMNNNLTASYTLMTDIDASLIANWIPIGISVGPQRSFSGNFDGGGHTIKNIRILQEALGSLSVAGFFGGAYNAEIRNIRLENLSLISSSSNANSNRYVGGLVGWAVAGTIIENASINGGNIYCSGKGGLASGGLARGTGFSIKDSYAKIDINLSLDSPSDYSSASGLAERATIMNSYFLGSITGNNALRLACLSIQPPSIINSYYNSDLCTLPLSGYGTPMTTAQMKTQAAYFGWDFTNIWTINSSINEGYPYLRAQ